MATRQRRDRGSGGITTRHDKRKDGTIVERKQGTVTLAGGKTKYVYGRTEREVKEKIRAVQRQIDQGLLIGSEKQTVADFLEHWLEDSKRPNLRPASYENYRMIVNSMKASIGHHRLCDLTPAHVEDFYAVLRRRGLKGSSILRVHVLLGQALNLAVKRGNLLRNPAKMVDSPRAERPEMAFLTHDQLLRLLDATKGDRRHALWALMGMCGLRFGEAAGLTWDDVEWETSTIKIRKQRTLIRGAGMAESPLKTEASRRDIVLPTRALAALRAHRAIQAEEKLKCHRTYAELNLVFANERGKPIRNWTTRRHLKRALAAAGLPDIRIHDLRHTAGTMLAAVDLHPRVAQQVLGHSDVRTTMQIYTHVTDEMRAEAARRLNVLLGGAPIEKEGL